MSGPSVHFRWPPAWYFKFPPATEPLTLPPPSDGRNFAAPFEIPSGFYRSALDWKVPITIALIYATTVGLVNKYNRERGNKPWGISKTRAFFAFVVVHNVFLALFSAITCWGMLRALAHTWPSYREYPLFGKSWPGLRTQNGLAGAADALCHMHGPRGFGDAVYYVPDKGRWVSKNRLISFAANGKPDPTDLGRLWNEGLAFYGFWFYISKFYEVLDTLIILAKGKRSQTLQTYHHAGAMMCMWAGIRFMSPPIWMFVFINSFIHTLMYTYYTLAALGVKVPQRIKRTLTTMQISQFLIGFTFAAAHLFVTYSVPVAMPYTIASTISSAASAATSVAASAFKEVTAAPSGGQLGAWLKQMAFRAAGEEGLAENVRDDLGQPVKHGPGVGDYIHDIREETSYRNEYQTIPCIDTQGQAFAIYLNLLYLAPLTWLFVRFFIRAYTRRGAANKGQPRARRISQSAHDAAHGVHRELEGLGKAAEDAVGDLADNLQSTSRSGSNAAPSTKGGDKRRVSHTIGHIAKQFEGSTEESHDTASNGSAKDGSLRKKPSEGHENLRRMFESGEARNGRQESPSPDRSRKPRPNPSASLEEDVKPYAKEAVEKLEEAATAAVEKAKQAVETDRQASGDALPTAESGSSETKSVASEVQEKAAGAAEDASSQDQPEAKAEAEGEPDYQRSDSSASSTSLSRQSTQQREHSPQKKPSRIPRAASKNRSTSPVKKSSPPTEANGTASRNRTPDPDRELTINETEFPQMPPPKSSSSRPHSPVKKDNQQASNGNHEEKNLADKIQAGEEPDFVQVVKGGS